MLKREIEIDGKLIPFRASANIPRLYRAYFKRDIFKDIVKLGEALEKVEKGKEKYGINDLEMFENVAYIMAKHADPKQPNTPEKWLEQFNVLSIYLVLPQILELWNLNMESTAESKKKLAEVAER